MDPPFSREATTMYRRTSGFTVEPAYETATVIPLTRTPTLTAQAKLRLGSSLSVGWITDFNAPPIEAGRHPVLVPLDGAAMVIVTVAVSDVAPSVAVIVKVVVGIATAGVPEITPVAEFSNSPAGSAGDTVNVLTPAI